MHNSSYLVKYNFLTVDEVDSLLDYWNSISEVSILSNNSWDMDRKVINDISIKGRKVRITGVQKELFKTISNKIESLFKSVLGVDASVEYPHYLAEYSQGSFHGLHYDKLPEMWFRDKVVTIQLSDSNEYEGGDLIIGDEIAPRDKGCAIIYNGKDLHQVTKVTKGTRFSLTECAGVEPKTVLI